MRVNDLASGHTAADLDAVMELCPDGIVQPKACGGSDVAHLAAMIAVREAEYGLEDGIMKIMAIGDRDRAQRLRAGQLFAAPAIA